MGKLGHISLVGDVEVISGYLLSIQIYSAFTPVGILSCWEQEYVLKLQKVVVDCIVLNVMEMEELFSVPCQSTHVVSVLPA